MALLLVRVTKARQRSDIHYFKTETMKRNVLFLLGIILSISIYAQTDGEYKSAKFITGCPKDIEPIKDQLGLKNFSYTNLETGTDSIKVVFGEFTQGNINGCWVSLYFNDNLTSFSTVPFEKDELSDCLSNNIDIKFDNSSKRISLYVKYDPTTHEILYSWLAGDQKSHKLTVQTVERLLAESKPLPELNLKTLTDRDILSTDLKGKFLVINWWATTCAPCRKEIPGLNKLVNEFASNPNIVFLAIAYDKKESLDNYLNSNVFEYLQTVGDKHISEIFGESFPKNLIVNPDGIITFYSEGGNEHTYQILEKELLEQMN